ncbi:MAG: hypothetical protein ABI548_15635 [Polyangiaceae bacterium]
MNRSRAAVFTLLAATAVGCGSSGSNDNGGAAGMSSTAQAGAPGTSGSSGTGLGGATMGAAGSGVGGTGNVAGNTVTAGSGGSGEASAGGGSTGVGGSHAGMSGAGMSGAGMSSSGGSTSTTAPLLSPGCQKKTPRPAGGSVEVATTSLHLFPASYDGTKPFPLLIALHACGNPNTEFVGLTKGTGFETDYVRTFPNTPDSGQCWSSYTGDVARILSQYDDLTNNYCIDLNRVFAIAHSSGAQMLVNILSHKTDAQHLKLKAVSPVAADPFKVALPMPVLYIDGKMDNQRSANSATDAVADFRAANMCMTTSKPYAPVMPCTSTDSGHPMVDPGCITYDGCSVPTIWCSHNDPSYSGTEHGVPCFAIKSMYDFFATLP